MGDCLTAAKTDHRHRTVLDHHRRERRDDVSLNADGDIAAFQLKTSYGNGDEAAIRLISNDIALVGGEYQCPSGGSVSFSSRHDIAWGMCGRTSLFVPLEDLESRFDAEYVANGGYQPRFNIAPHQPIGVIPNEAADEIDLSPAGFSRWDISSFTGTDSVRSVSAQHCPTQAHLSSSATCCSLQDSPTIYIHDWFRWRISSANRSDSQIIQGRNGEEFRAQVQVLRIQQYGLA